MNSARRDSFFACIAIGAAYTALLVKTWRKWPDMMVDFGQQLYFPWKISTGSVLYRDLAYLVGGPVSQYYHAALFKIFGVSFLTLIVSNIILTGVLLWVVYRCFYRSSDQLTAVTACLAIVLVFAFEHEGTSGIFNYMAPYCAEIVHGLILSVCAIALFDKWFRQEKLRLTGGVGFCIGLASLTKPEVFLALAITVCAGLLLFWCAKKRGRFLLHSMGAMAAGAIVPPAAFFIYFWREMDFRCAWRAVCGGWIPVLTTPTPANPYFRWCMGLDAPTEHLRQMLAQSLVLTVLVAAIALLCRRRVSGNATRWLFALAGVGLAGLSWAFNWAGCGQCLPLLCVTTLALLLWRMKTSGLDLRAVFPILWAVFSLGMLLKLGLFSRIWHYGFVLAMPAFLCTIYLLLWLLPGELERFQVQPVFWRGLIWVPLMVGMGQLTWHSLQIYAQKTEPVGAGADKFFAFNTSVRPDDTGVVIALHWMETNAPPQATLSVLPSSPMLNYLSRRTNPSRYPIWPPPEVIAFGVDKMTDAFIRHSPDYIIIVGVDYSGFGEEFFGQQKQFGGDLMAWINTHYQPQYLIGYDWVNTGYFGVKILRKIPTAPPRG